MRTSAIIVAAGSGKRAQMSPPKQYQDLSGQPVLAHTLKVFLDHPKINRVIAVISKDHRNLFEDLIVQKLHRSVEVVNGGNSRTESVMAGLNLLSTTSATHVLIHDGVRPFVSNRLIDRILESLVDHSAVVPGIINSDALWRTQGSLAVEPANRNAMIRVQTPQGFALEPLLDAYRCCTESADDDAAVAATAGIAVHTVNGEEKNVKLTTSEDFAEARRSLDAKIDVRAGIGVDVHRFGDGNSVILCGVSVPHDYSLIGHSDADVASHAITDAIYGSLAQGDIGRWFPPTDSKWKDASSMVFLKHASELARNLGFEISSLDCALICEAPRIAPYADLMAANVASNIGIEKSRVSIKATTSERLGFVGRGEGIAAMATASVVRS